MAQYLDLYLISIDLEWQYLDQTSKHGAGVMLCGDELDTVTCAGEASVSSLKQCMMEHK